MDSRLISHIDGVSISPLRQIGDDRGMVLHMLRSDDPEFVRFGECYFSEVLPGAVKAWKRHRVQTQMLAAPIGRVRLVIYDDRGESPTQGVVQILDLGRPDAYVRVMIRPGLWYGFTALGPMPGLLANCVDMPHDPSESERIAPEVASFPYSWDAGSDIPE